MFFFNKRKKQKAEEEEKLLEREAREKLDALREEKKKELEKKQENKQSDEAVSKEPSMPVYKNDRKRYIKECCDAIGEADRQIEGIRKEYQNVTDSLLDIQKIDKISGDERKSLYDYSNNIIRLTRERNKYKDRNLTIPEVVIRRFEPFEDELVDEIKRMYEAEKYQELIEKDLEILDGEKNKLRKEKQDIVENQKSLKVIAKFLIVVIVVMFITFVVLYYTMKADMTLPYLGSILLAAVSSTVIFVESNRNRRGMTMAERKMNKAMSLIKRVKIKYVNNMNVLEYNRAKFGVKSGEEFEKYWVEYCKAKEYERKFKENTEQLNYYCESLINILKNNELKESEVWTAQVLAIVDDREMVEIRHKLNQRRQILRERIEYNEKVKSQYLNSINELIEKYPENRSEILSLISKNK